MTLTAEETHHHLSLQLDASDIGPRPHPSTTIGIVSSGVGLVVLGGIVAKHIADPTGTGPVMVTTGVMLLLAVVIQCSVSWYLYHRSAVQLATAAARRDAEQDAALQRLAEVLLDRLDSKMEGGARLIAAATVQGVRQELAAKTAVDELAAEFAAYRERVDSDLANIVLSRAPKASVVGIDSHRH